MNITEEIIERFNSLHVKSDTCWEWVGCKDVDGYGRMRIGGRKAARAHRVSWEIANGKSLGSLLVCHHCDNPSCVNPGHLYAGTAKQNNQDKLDRGRCNWSKGERSGTAKLTADQVDEIFDLYRKGGVRQIDLAEKFNVSQGAIQLILSGKNWSHTGKGKIVGMRNSPKPALRKLSDEAKETIADEYRTGGVSQRELAARYGVSQQLISLLLVIHGP